MARKYLEEELEKWAKTYANALFPYLPERLDEGEFLSAFYKRKCVCRGVHGHTEGSRPWAWAENNIEELMANVVGKRHQEVAQRWFLFKHSFKEVLTSLLKPQKGKLKIYVEYETKQLIFVSRNSNSVFDIFEIQI